MQGPSPRKSDRRSVLRAGLARWKGGLLRNGSALVPGVAFPKNRNSEGRETRLLLLPSHIQFAWRPESLTKGPRCSNLFKTGEPMSNRLFLAGSIVASAGILALGLAGAGFGTPMEMADKPSSWGFETANLDKTCKPCDDFDQFAMGGWMKSNPIPPEYSSWGSFTQLADKNHQNLRQILEAAASAKAAPGSNEQKIGDFYASCMDTATIDAAGTKPIEPDLARIASIKTVADLQAVTEYLHSQGIGALFRFNSTQDAKDSTQVIGAAFQGGLGLPEREYYLKEDDKSKQLREAYTKHVAKMLELLGDYADQSAAEAATILKIETALATASMKHTDLRDPDKTYHKMMLADLRTLTPNFSWEAYFKAAGHPELKEINVGQPDFFRAIDAQLTATPIDDWRTYLLCKLLNTASAGSTDKIVAEYLC